MIYRTRTKRQLTIESLFEMPSEPESKPFYTFKDGDDVIEVLNDTFTLVLSRDVRKNARIAAQMSFAIARENPDLDVWYVNTYAGVAMLKEAFAKELQKSGMPLPEPKPDPLPLPEAPPPVEATTVEEMPPPAPVEPPKRIPQIDVNTLFSTPSKWKYNGTGWELNEENATEDEREYIRLRRNPPPKEVDVSDAAEEFEDYEDEDYDEEEEDEEDEEEENGPSMLPNFFIHDVPLGTWNTAVLRRDIERRGRLEKQPVVVLNSFEFASMNRGQKDRCVMQLIELRDQLGLTFVVFSHEMKRDLGAGIPGRGPLGVLAAKAGVVLRLNDPFEHLIRSRKSEAGQENASKYSGNGIIHEAQMHTRRPPYTDAERDRLAKLAEEFPGYHVNPWLGGTRRLGRDLVPFTRSSILRQYYTDHPNTLFTRGEEPTERELETGTYIAREEEKLSVI